VLWLWGRPVTDAGLEELVDLKNLAALHAAKTKVTDAGVAQLQKIAAEM